MARSVAQAVTHVTAARIEPASLSLSLKCDAEGSSAMLIRFSCLMLALVACVPGAFATLHQAAQIIA
jgi:hypothetical protein